MKRFLTHEIKKSIDYVIDNAKNIKKNEIKDYVYNEVELFMRAKYKLKHSDLLGTTQQYEKKLDVFFKTIIKTSCFIEVPVQFNIPASYPAIIDVLITNLKTLLEYDDVKYIVDIVLDKNNHKLRKTSDAYNSHIDKKYFEFENEIEWSSGEICNSEYEIGYILIPTSNKLIISRNFEDIDMDNYVNHPLFFTNGI